MTIQLNLPKQLNKCLLREIEKSDAVAIADIEYDPELKHFFKLPEIPKKDYIRDFDPQLTRGFAIETLDKKEVVGTIDFGEHGNNNRVKELRIFIKGTHSGQGIGYDALSYMIGRLFDAQWVEMLVAVIDAENIESIGLFKKARFRDTGNTDENGKLIFERNR